MAENQKKKLHRVSLKLHEITLRLITVGCMILMIFLALCCLQVNVSVLERDQCFPVIESMDQLVRIRYKDPSHPVLHDDRDRLVRVYILWVEDCYLKDDLQQMTANIWNVSDILLNKSACHTWNTIDYLRLALNLPAPYNLSPRENNRLRW